MVRTSSDLTPDCHCDIRDIEHWLERVGRHYTREQQEMLRRASRLALEVDGSERLWSGECRLHYALASADILAHLKMDSETLAVALLNGVLRKPELAPETLRRDYGPQVAHMVEDLDKIKELTGTTAVIAPGERAQHAENLRRLLLGIAEDVRVVLVVLAERLQLMRSIKELDADTRRRAAQDTRDIYAPLANRLGIWQIKWELEDLSLRFLEPDQYRRIASLLDGRRRDRERYIAGAIALLQGKFKENGIAAEVTGRPKHIFSIWRKMERKRVDFDQIYDVRALRVLVRDVADCYAALGVVHGLWRHIPGEFDDYIATPKSNMYQSLHTAVVGPGDKPLEVQIRTHDMNRHAELGVAAHWRYKESTEHDAEFERRVAWMRHWLELKEEQGTATDFLERFKSEFEPVKIYVLTPRAKVIELPKGATPLDFAYAIHSEVGHHCRGARVNAKLVPLSQSLASGQTVEILTARNGTPSRDWLLPHLGYLKTARARNRVRQWFKHQDYEYHVSMGRTGLERELTRLGVTERPDLDKVAAKHNFQKGEDVLAAIGRGELSPIQVAGQSPGHRPRARPQRSEPKVRTPHAHSDIVVEGVPDLMTHMAGCCKPVPYDPIVGFITRGKGVTVHRRNCLNLRHLAETEQQRLVKVRWSEQPVDATYPVDILVTATDRKGLLRDVSSVLTNEEIDVTGVHTLSDRSSDTATMEFTVEIAGVEQLSRILHRMSQLPEVLEARRRI